jgi:hypothetical protein
VSLSNAPTGFLEDGDEVVIAATASGADGEVISCDEVRGRVTGPLPARRTAVTG